MKNILAALSLITLFYGCAAIELSQEKWIGSDLDDLIFAWGPPSNTSNLSDRRKVVRYSRDSIGEDGASSFCNIDVFADAGNTIVRIATNGANAPIVENAGCRGLVRDLETR